MNITEAAPPIDKMANIYDNSFIRIWNFLFHDLMDPRTRDWFFVSSPVPGLSILIGYHYFIRSWGPKYMEHRKPFQMKNILVIYNFMQVLFSIWIFWEALDAAWLRNYSFKCEPVDNSNTPEALRIAKGVYMYFLAKMTELLDTVFFVLRKKDKQVTFLHVYHHTVMPMIAWGAVAYYPGGHGTFIGLINSFVHIVMYTYYLLAVLLPQYQKYLWWKKYITTLQMGQFCLVFLHNCQLLVYDCGFPRWSVIFTLPNIIFFYFLFFDFYKMAYGNSEKSKVNVTKTKTKTKPTSSSTTTTTTTTTKTLANGKIEFNDTKKLNGNVNDYENTSNVSSNGKIKIIDKGEKQN